MLLSLYISGLDFKVNFPVSANFVIQVSFLNFNKTFDVRSLCNRFLRCICVCYKTIFENPEVSIQITKNAKRNRYKQTNEVTKNAKRNRYKQTNEHWYSRPLWPFSKGLRRSTKWKPDAHQLVKNESRYENQTHIN